MKSQKPKLKFSQWGGVNGKPKEDRDEVIAAQIELYVKTNQAYLNPHLRLENVVDHCTYCRSNVSKVFRIYFGGFSNYVNALRLEHYDRYVESHPNVTIEAAAQESGFTCYRSYHRARQKTYSQAF